MSTLKHQKCHFCLLPNDAIFRIPWYEWLDSSMADMYELVMKQKVPFTFCMRSTIFQRY